jgi:hypothetical protein
MHNFFSLAGSLRGCHQIADFIFLILSYALYFPHWKWIFLEKEKGREVLFNFKTISKNVAA